MLHPDCWRFSTSVLCCDSVVQKHNYRSLQETPLSLSVCSASYKGQFYHIAIAGRAPKRFPQKFDDPLTLQDEVK